ncbi:response regulator [Spirosoma endophyticum]|uniref:Response regulator receiver domain-containing protein n=1 Tax=Spirosoma endophyticum TaxID=662367 RepID=A0A1I2GMK3_9BACT|nr:response regulator [Spirosoma endophyticum]SFF18488.1 Response regulator receiver domain-containing protein [Spirosoma endophyticum]
MRKFKNLDCVLLVDDDRFINLAQSKAVERAGIGVNIRAVTTVEEALDFLTFSGIYEGTQAIPRPGIILLDINMPGLTGWDFIDLYHKLDEAYKAKVIIVMLTTSMNPVDQKRALSTGAVVDFLHKPLKPEMVIDLAERYFEVDETILS